MAGSHSGTMLTAHGFSLLTNPRHGTPGLVVLPDSGFLRARAEISTWPGYAPTKLLDLDGIAPVASLRLKDEAGRFGLGSFKARGGAYAVLRVLLMELARRGIAAQATAAELLAGKYRDAMADITVTCATDGNHGRAVAWGALRFGCNCVIFVHETVSQGRVDAIAAYGATMRRVPGTYDNAVREAARVAAEEGWFVISDTSYPGYTAVPVDVMQGYRIMADEALDQWQGPQPTHVFIQGGVGGVASGTVAYGSSRSTFGTVRDGDHRHIEKLLFSASNVLTQVLDNNRNNPFACFSPEKVSSRCTRKKIISVKVKDNSACCRSAAGN